MSKIPMINRDDQDQQLDSLEERICKSAQYVLSNIDKAHITSEKALLDALLEAKKSGVTLKGVIQELLTTWDDCNIVESIFLALDTDFVVKELATPELQRAIDYNDKRRVEFLLKQNGVAKHIQANGADCGLTLTNSTSAEIVQMVQQLAPTILPESMIAQGVWLSINSDYITSGGVLMDALLQAEHREIQKIHELQKNYDDYSCYSKPLNLESLIASLIRSKIPNASEIITSIFSSLAQDFVVYMIADTERYDTSLFTTAVSHDNIMFVEFFLKYDGVTQYILQGENVSRSGMTAAHSAEMVRILAPVSTQLAKDIALIKGIDSPFLEPDTIYALLDIGANVDAHMHMYNGYTPLMLALKNSKLNLAMKLFYKYSADPSIAALDGATAGDFLETLIQSQNASESITSISSSLAQDPELVKCSSSTIDSANIAMLELATAMAFSLDIMASLELASASSASNSEEISATPLDLGCKHIEKLSLDISALLRAPLEAAAAADSQESIEPMDLLGLPGADA